MPPIGKYLVIIGIVITITGLIIWFAGNKMNWFGNLPGDLKVEKDNFKFYAPFASMVLISIVITLILWLIRKF